MSPIISMFPFQPSPQESYIWIVYVSGNSTHSENGAPPDKIVFPSQSIIDHSTSLCQSPLSQLTLVPSQTSSSTISSSSSVSQPTLVIPSDPLSKVYSMSPIIRIFPFHPSP